MKKHWAWFQKRLFFIFLKKYYSFWKNSKVWTFFKILTIFFFFFSSIFLNFFRYSSISTSAQTTTKLQYHRNVCFSWCGKWFRPSKGTTNTMLTSFSDTCSIGCIRNFRMYPILCQRRRPTAKWKITSARRRSRKELRLSRTCSRGLCSVKFAAWCVAQKAKNTTNFSIFRWTFPRSTTRALKTSTRNNCRPATSLTVSRASYQLRNSPRRNFITAAPAKKSSDRLSVFGFADCPACFACTSNGSGGIATRGES